MCVIWKLKYSHSVSIGTCFLRTAHTPVSKIMNVLIFLSVTKETRQNWRIVRYYPGPREAIWNGT